jgi:hypothetical protein
VAEVPGATVLRTRAGGHSPETPLTGDTKSEVEAAVPASYPNATIERTETDTDGSAPYESHIKTGDGPASRR